MAPQPSTEDARVRFLRAELERVLTLIRVAEDQCACDRGGEAAETLERARQGIVNARVFVRMLRLTRRTEAELTEQLVNLEVAIESAWGEIPFAG